LDQAAKNPKLVALDADLMLDSGLIPFKKEFPERYFQCGIAEQDMVSQAGGMALNGLIPVVHSFACFLSTRPNEQIYTNATEGTKIIYMSGLAGLIPGGTGHSHQSVRDISAVAAVPGMLLIQPSTDVEVEMAVDFCVNQHDQSSYLRLTPLPIETPYQLPDGYQLELGKGVALTDGDDAVMFAYGPVMLSQAVQASINLKNQEIGLKVVNLPWLNTVDADWLAETVGSHDAVFTLDDHYLTGGQGDMVLSQLSQLALESHPKARKLGVDRIPECGSNDDVLHAHGLDAEGIAATVTSELGK
jgi:transketolase